LVRFWFGSFTFTKQELLCSGVRSSNIDEQMGEIARHRFGPKEIVVEGIARVDPEPWIESEQFVN